MNVIFGGLTFFLPLEDLRPPSCEACDGTML